MKRYVDGYVIPLPKKKVAAYRRLASEAGAVWMKYGALQYVECVGEDLAGAAKWGCTPFAKAAKSKRNETVVFSFIIYRSRAHRDQVNAKVAMDPIMSPERMKRRPMPFDNKRMVVGGFETIVMRERSRKR